MNENTQSQSQSEPQPHAGEGASSHEFPSAEDLKSRFEAFQARAKVEWETAEAKAKAELGALPTKIRSGASQAWTRFRDGLDLPRRGEVAALAARIDELAQKLADYESQLAGKQGPSARAKD